MNTVNFSDLVGSRANLYAVDTAQYRFKLGKIVFQVNEDPDDGYRSVLKDVEIIDSPCFENYKILLAQVTIQVCSMTHIEGYDLIDDNGHVWLTFGTNHADEYYPGFHFYYEPYEYKIALLKEDLLS
jgi:hypothetical protein